MFSVLAPKKHIPEHLGLWKGVLRYHLGLIVPKPVGSSRIRVGEDAEFWEEGKSMIFDDSHPHEVWNDCDSHRIVWVRRRGAPTFLLALSSQSSNRPGYRPIIQLRRTDGPCAEVWPRRAEDERSQRQGDRCVSRLLEARTNAEEG
jgi:hypothetical protein